MVLLFLTTLSFSLTMQKLPSTGTPPSPRKENSMIYRNLTNELVMFGGKTDPNTFSNDLWLFNLDNQQ